MSFSKAKLLRFNDIKNCVPAPGTYNPKYDGPVIGALIPSGERFVEPRSPVGSTCSDSHSVASTNSVPSFRTPNMPVKKKILANSTDKKKTISLFNSKESEALREKIVECQNKDDTIKELETQIEEMKSVINALKTEIEIVTSEKEQLLSELEAIKMSHEEELAQLKEDYELKIANINIQLSAITSEKKEMVSSFEVLKADLKAQNLAEIEALKSNLDLLEHRIKENVQEREIVFKSLEDKLTQSETNCATLQSELFIQTEKYVILENKLKDLEDTNQEILKNHESEIKSLNELHQTEVQDIEYEMLKIQTEWSKIVENIEKENVKKTNDIRHHNLNEVNIIQENYARQIIEVKIASEAQIKQIEENCCEKIKLAEIQMEEQRKQIEADFHIKIREQKEKADEILKECQSISEYSIIQCELEKNEIVNRLKQDKDDLILENTKIQEVIHNITIERATIISELNSVKEKLEEEKRIHKSNMENAQVEKHNYEITLIKTHQTIDALKNRLLNSDGDVEQLKSEIEQIEKNLLTLENKYTKLLDELDSLKVTNKNFQSENVFLKNELKKTVTEVHMDLMEKVDEFKKQAQGMLDLTQTKINDLENENEQLKVTISNMEETVTNISRHNLDMKKKNEDLLKQLDNKNEEIHSLSKVIQEQNDLIGPFREQLENYEKEYKSLLLDKNEAEKEAKEISLKYAEMLGHQNIKQKIKYMVDLKKKNIELREIKTDNETKLYKQQLLIDKLKLDVRSLQHKNEKKQKRRSRSMVATQDKENICSPAKTHNNNVLKVDSPLKERN